MNSQSGIPLGNLWLLMLYASDFNLSQTRQAIRLIENDHLDQGLMAWFTQLLEDYLQDPNTSYVGQRQALAHIRGQVDLKQTYQRQSLQQGKVYCRYATLSFNHPQHQYLALVISVMLKHSQAGLKARLLRCQRQLKHMGVAVPQHSTYNPSQTRFGHTQKQLQQLLLLAKVLLEFQLPSTQSGQNYLLKPNAEGEHWLRRLFEKAMAGFYKKYLDRSWRVLHGAILKWPRDAEHAALPQMKTDLILQHQDGRCILMDTKFTQVFAQGYYRKRDLFKNQHIYQIYTYLRSQEYLGSRFQFSQGILLYPSIDETVEVDVSMQDYQIGFHTLDLTESRLNIERKLLGLLDAALKPRKD